MPFADDEELLTERELARYIRRSRRQLQRDRAERRGIPFLQFETQVRYRLGDVRTYVARHVVGSNGEQGAAIVLSQATRSSRTAKQSA